MRRGEHPIQGRPGHHRVERPDAGALLSKLDGWPPKDAAELGPDRYHVSLPLGDAELRRCPGRGRSFDRAAHRVRVLGVSTPRVLAHDEHAVVLERVSAPTLADLASSGLLSDPGARRRATISVSRLLGRLRVAGLGPAGLGLSDIRLDGDEAVLLDPLLVQPRWTRAGHASGLVQLGRALWPALFGPVELGRFLDGYLRPCVDPRSERARWWALLAVASRRAPASV